MRQLFACAVLVTIAAAQDTFDFKTTVQARDLPKVSTTSRRMQREYSTRTRPTVYSTISRPTNRNSSYYSSPSSYYSYTASSTPSSYTSSSTPSSYSYSSPSSYSGYSNSYASPQVEKKQDATEDLAWHQNAFNYANDYLSTLGGSDSDDCDSSDSDCDSDSSDEDSSDEDFSLPNPTVCIMENDCWKEEWPLPFCNQGTCIDPAVAKVVGQQLLPPNYDPYLYSLIEGNYTEYYNFAQKYNVSYSQYGEVSYGGYNSEFIKNGSSFISYNESAMPSLQKMLSNDSLPLYFLPMEAQRTGLNTSFINQVAMNAMNEPFSYDIGKNCSNRLYCPVESDYDDKDVKRQQDQIIGQLQDFDSFDIEMLQLQVNKMKTMKKREMANLRNAQDKINELQNQAQMKFLAESYLCTQPQDIRKSLKDWYEDEMNIELDLNCKGQNQSSGEDEKIFKAIVTLGKQINQTQYLENSTMAFSIPYQTVVKNPNTSDLKKLWVSEISTNVDGYGPGYQWVFNLNDGSSFSYMDDVKFNLTVLKLNQEDQPIKKIVMAQNDVSLTGIQIYYFDHDSKSVQLGNPSDSDKRTAYTLKKNQRLLGFTGIYQKSQITAFVNLQPYFIEYEP